MSPKSSPGTKRHGLERGSYEHVASSQLKSLTMPTQAYGHTTVQCIYVLGTMYLYF
jgi:hypothetical protein